MKATNHIWKERLAAKLPDLLASEIDQFEQEMELRQADKIDEKIFAETRLRRGAYGQRYDNGQRYDGEDTRDLAYDPAKKTKGPNTVWDAPGMQRIKVPYGGLTVEQLELMADLAEEYSDGIAHVTTRQDFQLHFVHIEDTPALMRRLASAGITTREACGNSVRNVTGCPYAGVCSDEAFDVTPYARALMQFLLGHPDVQNFGRKFKPSFSGCAGHACGLASMHDLAYIAAKRTVDGVEQRGFKILVGGGLGTVPYQAQLFEEFMPVEEMMPIAQAIARVFAKHGEKKNRARARIKFLVKEWGVEKFKAAVMEERAKLEPDPRWSELLEGALDEAEKPSREPGELPELNGDENLRQWLKTNTRPQNVEGFVTATVVLPLGDITADQLRSLSDIVQKYTNGTIRSTVEQNFVIRWVSKADLPALYKDLAAAGLADAGAGNIVDIVSCPGTDTCKLGVSASRGLAGELRERLATTSFKMDQAIQNLHIKISGCFNSCGQHHVGDLGFYGVSRNLNGFKVPHFQVVLGGRWEENAGSYGLPIVAVPSKRIPEAVEMLTGYYLKEREKDESFAAFVKRVGKAQMRAMLETLKEDAPTPEADPDFYRDWSDTRSYTTGDIGKGECAGEVVSAYEFAMTDAERMVFNAQILLEGDKAQEASDQAYKAMLKAAKALVQIQYDDVSNDAEEIVEEFTERFYDTKVFFDTYAGGKFAEYFFAAHEKAGQPSDAMTAKHTIEEAQLFIEAVHTCYNKGAGAETAQA